MRLEYLSGDLKMGRMLREQLGKVNRNDLRWWLGATYLEISAREYDEARNLFKEALAVILPESTSRLLSEWEQLELQNGTLETWLDFVQIAKKYPRDEKIFDRPMQKKRTEEPLVVNKLLEKRGKVSPVESKEPEYDPKTTVFLNNLSFKATEQDIKTFLGQLVETEPSHVVISHDKSGKSRGLAHAVFSSEILVQKTIAQDRTLFMGRPLFISEYQPIPKTERRRIEYQTGRDPKVLFVSHLADETTKEDIDALFSGRNGFKASRLVITKAGHFKGAAYVEFEDEPSASQALGVDGTDLRGSRIRVQISDPKLAKSRAARLQMVPRAVQASKHARPRIQKT
jgi:RNA recognition motif-containing protein